jgi:hypothetical protein
LLEFLYYDLDIAKMSALYSSLARFSQAMLVTGASVGTCRVFYMALI